ncbi:MAG TPA: hypothetical protein VHV51_10445 [Polyangiaceae bacterium]|jgi:hypothetical protein|nr:hypothetical protein [Polyangiaceae bacterium]
MPLFWVSFAVALETRAAASLENQLGTAALASPRPRECRGAANGEDGLWQRARAGDRERYCEILARGYARLAESPNEALSAAAAALAIAGETPELRVLRGRAKLRLGQAPAALDDFAKAERADRQAFLAPKALHDYARAASLAGQPADAVRLYRMLVSRSALMDDAREKTVLEIEAAAHVLAYAQNGSDEALGYLAQARRDALGLEPWINGLRLLIAERGGHAERTPGSSAPPSLQALNQPLAESRAGSPLLPPGEFEALRAVLAEDSEASGWRELWQAFLKQARPENLWLEQARKKSAELGAAKGKVR